MLQTQISEEHVDDMTGSLCSYSETGRYPHLLGQGVPRLQINISS
jgi:hypothetical protein